MLTKLSDPGKKILSYTVFSAAGIARESEEYYIHRYAYGGSRQCPGRNLFCEAGPTEIRRLGMKIRPPG